MSEENKMSVTLIKELKESEKPRPNEIILNKKDSKALKEIIMDLDISLENRIKAIQLFYEQYNEQSIELINRLATMYTFSGTKSLQNYIYEICTNSSISNLLKIICAKSLCFFDSKKNIGYDALDHICKTMSTPCQDDIATPCQIEAVCLLMKNKKFKLKARNYFCEIINNINLDCDYRYKTILSLENKTDIDSLYFIKEAAFEFFQNKKNMTLYRILSGQYMMQHSKLSTKQKNIIEKTIMEFAQDPDLDYDLRADSADVILRLGSEKNKSGARKIIIMLGREGSNNNTIFDNAQNVHENEIEESVIEVLEYLSSIEIRTISGKPGTPLINFEYVKKQIEDSLKKQKPKNNSKKNSIQLKEYEDKLDKITVALNRIYMDRALYSKYNCTLLNILLKIWTYLSYHDSQKEMIKRLLQELYEMSGTCSTGFASRLVNVISGFGEFNLRISWRDQIVANFNGRLNARIRDITNPEHKNHNFKLYCKNNDSEVTNSEEEILQDFQSQVLCEMTTESYNFESRKHFLLFFRKNMLTIRQELHQEFNNYITDTDFDLYFRQAISNYETGGYV